MNTVRQLSQPDTLVKPKWSVRVISSHPIVQKQAGRILRCDSLRQVYCVLFFFAVSLILALFRSDNCLSKNVTTLTATKFSTGKICSKLS